MQAKAAARNNIFGKLANSTWGADPKTLQTTALALSNSTAEYASPVWARSCHAKKIHPALKNACQIVTRQLSHSYIEQPGSPYLTPRRRCRQGRISTCRRTTNDTQCLTTNTPRADLSPGKASGLWAVWTLIYCILASESLKRIGNLPK